MEQEEMDIIHLNAEFFSGDNFFMEQAGALE